MKSIFEIKSAGRSQPTNLVLKNNKLSVEMQKKVAVIQVRELDKRLTHANPKMGKCTLEGCMNASTHWLTRQNADYCQSDMICNQHAQMWMQVRDLVALEDSEDEYLQVIKTFD